MPSKQQSIILGGVVVGLLSTSYLGMINLLCCAGVLAGSLIAVWHYTTNNELTLRSGQGVSLGVMAALLGWAIAFVVNFALIKAGVRSDLAISQFILDRFGDSMPPESVDQMIDQMEQPITLGMYAINSLLGVVFSVIFGAIGGAIGAAVFKNGDEDEE